MYASLKMTHWITHLQMQCLFSSTALIFNSSPLFISVSWCVLSDAEEQKCLDLAGNATARNIRGTLECVRGEDTKDCLDKIKVRKETGMGNHIDQSALHKMNMFPSLLKSAVLQDDSVSLCDVGHI